MIGSQTSSASQAAPPKVSVCLITCNHEAFVGQAIEGALAQQTRFPYEIVIGDDCSTDSTRGILAAFHARHPDRIRRLLSRRNLGANSNCFAAHVFRACRGQYVALLDGDDYWTSPCKLQRQADLLDEHPECSSCFHDVALYRERIGWESPTYNHPGQKVLATMEDLLTNNFIATSSVMLRARVFARLPKWFYPLTFGDWALHLLCAQHGTIRYLDEVMGVYRIHEHGLWSGMSKPRQIEELITFYEDIDAILGYRYSALITRLLTWHHHEAAEYYQASGDAKRARVSRIRAGLVKYRLSRFPAVRRCMDRGLQAYAALGR